jgi:lysophospholipid hydrolase
LEWKTSNSGSQLSQHTPDMPECDIHWPCSATLNQPLLQPGESSDGTGIHSGNTSRKHSKNEGIQQPLDETQVVQIATEAFVKELGLEDDTLLKEGKVQIREVPTGTYLMKEESHKVYLIYKLF